MIPDSTVLTRVLTSFLPEQWGLWFALGAAMLFPCVLVLPLRGGHGQHAHAGPGALTLDHLTRTLDRADRGGYRIEEITWPPAFPDSGPTDSETADSETAGAACAGPDVEEPSVVERELAALLHLFAEGPEPGYIGRHRRAEPAGFGTPSAAVRPSPPLAVAA